MSLLQVSGVSKRFGGVQAVDAVGFEAGIGEVVGLFGPNGAGKTTLFNLIAGSIRPDAGSVHFDGRDITRLSVLRRARLGIGRTFQIVRPFRELSVAENVAAVDPASGTEPVDPMDLLERVGLADRAGSMAGTLTLGMLKRLEVARALALRPRLLLLDEPLAGLTGRESAEILALVQALKPSMAVVLVEHNVRMAMPACDRTIVLDRGAVIASGAPDDIRRDPRVIAAYLGTKSQA